MPGLPNLAARKRLSKATGIGSHFDKGEGAFSALGLVHAWRDVLAHQRQIREAVATGSGTCPNTPRCSRSSGDLMSHSLRFVTSVKASLPEVWAALARARGFVVSPYAALQARFDRSAELLAGHAVHARLVAGPFALFHPWRVQVHDRDANRLSMNGAEGFGGQSLWDYKIVLGEAGPRCVVDCLVTLPRKHASPVGICISQMFDRRHLTLKALLLSARRTCDNRETGLGRVATTDGRIRHDKSARRPRACSFITLPLYRQLPRAGRAQ